MKMIARLISDGKIKDHDNFYDVTTLLIISVDFFHKINLHCDLISIENVT